MIGDHVDKWVLTLCVVWVLCSGIALAQVIGSYKTSAITIALGKTNYVYSIVTPKDNDYLIVCPGIQIGVPASYLTKKVNITQTRLQKIDFSKCKIFDVDTWELIAPSSITTRAVG
jgi:hypothetical protein